MGHQLHQIKEFRFGWKNATLIRIQDNFTCEANRACITTRVRTKCTLFSYRQRGHVIPVVSPDCIIHISSNVSLCLYNLTVRQCVERHNGTEWNITVSESDMAVWLVNASAIANRTIYGMKIEVVPATSRPDPAQVVPIPGTCQPLVTGLTKTKVHWTVNFPPFPPCPRQKRVWYDTILGGSGTLLGLSNMVDGQITTSKLHYTGQSTSAGLDLVAQWMPTALKGQQQNVRLWKEMFKIDWNKWNTTDGVFKNITQLLNWTICSIQHVNALMQRERMQRVLTSDNYHEWRQQWNIYNSLWLHLYSARTKCNDTMCYGKYDMYNVTHPHLICKFHVLPVIVHGAYWVLRVKGEWLDAAKDVTYDLTGCDETDKGVVCPLRSSYTNQCLKDENALCDWDYQKPDDLLFQLGPHTLCVVTMNQHPCTPFSGCLRNVHVWTWHNITYKLLHTQ
ncbi:uncharacterized protein LOC129410337 [Boleophthalmus pectinirostris]|uniref:uncharacterized protein LOC129410337 n=1 Tax=Boleophthalmus pectinirostris TaxID=150288 RepID=UPI00242D36DD|nr:uncharacterized protein LOC129410337 [Boleophthalmus pectinirostris]